MKEKLFSLPENVTSQARSAWQSTWSVLVITVLALPMYIYMGFQSRAWQFFAMVGMLLFMLCIHGLVLRMIRTGSNINGMRLLIGLMIAITFPMVFIFGNNVGSSIGLIIFAMSLLFAVRTLPSKDLAPITFIGLVTVAAVVVIDLFAPATQLSFPIGETITPVIAGLTIITSIFLIAREFRNISLASKLLLTFLAITIIPFVILGFLFIRVTAQNMTDTAGSGLKNFASSQAAQIGGILAGEEESLRHLAINPVLGAEMEAIDDAYSNDPATIQANLKRQESTWQNLPDNDPLVQQILNHKITEQFNKYLDTFPNNLDLLITDKYGAVVASTRRPLNYYVADQEWWQDALDDGAEDVSISQPSIKYPGDKLSIFMAIPIVATGTTKVIGVLRANYSMQPFTEVLTQETAGTRTGADLLLPGGQVYRVEGDIVKFDDETYANLNAIEDKVYGQFFYDEGPSLVSQSPIVTQDPDLVPVLKQLGWHVIHDAETGEALQSLKSITEIGVLSGLLVMLIITMIAIGLSRGISLPVIRLTQTAQQIADGDLNAQATIASKDEIGTLGTTFNVMTSQLRQTLEEVEKQTVALQINSKVLSRQAIQLQAAADVSRSVSSELNKDELIRKAVNLVRDRFDLYYVGLFLLDEQQQFAVLEAGTGEAGDNMLASGYKLEINENSMIGRCISHQQACIAQKTDKEFARFRNPFLPNTHSELALPLISQGQVIGAISVQSEQESAFSPEDITILQTMGDQLANGIEKARLYEQIQQRAIELDKAREAADSAKNDAEKARIIAEEANHSLAAQMWLAAGQTLLNEKMRGEQDISTLANNVIQHLCKYIQASSGAIYILDNEILRLSGTYAYRKKSTVQEYQIGEDLVGQAALEKGIIHSEFPDKYIALSLRHGEILPRFSLVIPITYNQETSGVVVLESMTELGIAQKRFLEEAMESVAIALMTAQARARVNELFTETRQQAEELQAQEEELRATNEELQAQTESLRALKDDRDMLR
jgi:GAF domain-containing protein/HAMP domain-containing protein